MKTYMVKEKLELLEDTDMVSDALCVVLMNHIEAAEQENELLPSCLKKVEELGIHYCWAEKVQAALVGTFYIPSHDMDCSHAGFCFILEAGQLTFVDESGLVQCKLEEMVKMHIWETPRLGEVFADFLQLLISKDALFITKLENQLANLEDEVLTRGIQKNFNHEISEYRRKTIYYSNYYLQLSDMVCTIQEDDNHFLDTEESRLFQVLGDRVDLLREEIQTLREYSVQIREVYQAQIDVHQNEIMKVLTIVTTVFLPLTLIVGWYGMNFENMPELRSAYGYPSVIMFSLFIVAFCIWWIKRKKFW